MYLKDYLTFSLNFSDLEAVGRSGKAVGRKSGEVEKIKGVDLKGVARFELSVKQAYAL